MRRKSPKYTLLNTRSTILQKRSTNNPKNSLQALQILQSEVEKSKIAVENITTFGSTDSNFKQKIDFIQNQLQSCITNINVQNKRNKLLNELIAVLKGEMFKYQANEKKKQEAESIKIQKMMKKVEYQIDQICQKHNQEIAKIHQLKDLASSRRSERVVYSNLFKKLQREIKHYEEVYKEQLIKSQSVQYKKTKLAEEKIIMKKDIIDEQGEFDGIINQDNSFGESKNYPQHSNWNYNSSFQNTACKNEETKKKKTELQYRNEDHKMHTFIKQDKPHPAKEIRKKILQCTNNIQKIKIYTECSSVQQILQHYSSLESQNENINEKIREEDSKIDAISQQITKLTHEVNRLKFDKNYKENLDQQAEPNNQDALTTEKCKIKEQFETIMELTGFIVEEQTCHNYDNIVKYIDLIIEELLEKSEKNQWQQNKYDSLKKKKIRADSVSSQLLVDTILDRMQKFNNCQRIMDRKYLQQEYLKELNKKKNSQIKYRK